MSLRLPRLGGRGAASDSQHRSRHLWPSSTPIPDPARSPEAPLHSSCLPPLPSAAASLSPINTALPRQNRSQTGPLLWSTQPPASFKPQHLSPGPTIASCPVSLTTSASPSTLLARGARGVSCSHHHVTSLPQQPSPVIRRQCRLLAPARLAGLPLVSPTDPPGPGFRALAHTPGLPGTPIPTPGLLPVFRFQVTCRLLHHVTPESYAGYVCRKHFTPE